MKKPSSVLFASVSLLLLSLGVSTSQAFPTYSSRTSSADPVGGRCSSCHGDFTSDSYVSRTDGKNWGSLHDLHRFVMLAEDDPATNKCRTCHMTGPPGPPVYTYQSAGNGVLDPISCVGCHGRSEDGHGHGTHGTGAGLRQHHWNSGVTFCVRCHSDADPADFATAAENYLPPFYYPDGIFLNKPTDSCNINGEENYGGLLWGLDNDGDGKYDVQDSDCKPPGMITVCHELAGSAGGARTISINLNALPGHTEHGDLLGACD